MVTGAKGGSKNVAGKGKNRGKDRKDRKTSQDWLHYCSEGQEEQ